MLDAGKVLGSSCMACHRCQRIGHRGFLQTAACGLNMRGPGVVYGDSNLGRGTGAKARPLCGSHDCESRSCDSASFSARVMSGSRHTGKITHAPVLEQKAFQRRLVLRRTAARAGRSRIVEKRRPSLYPAALVIEIGKLDDPCPRMPTRERADDRGWHVAIAAADVGTFDGVVRGAPVAASAASAIAKKDYEIKVRFSDGSMAVFKRGWPRAWQLGSGVIVIGRLNASNG